MRILIAEDDPTTAEVLAQHLLEGFEVERVETLGGVLVRLKYPPFPDAVILDLRLADSSREDTIRAIPGISAVAPVMVFSGWDDAITVERVVAAGACRFISKTKAVLSGISDGIARAIESRRLRDKIDKATSA